MEVSEALMRLGVDELDDFVVSVQLLRIGFKAGVTTDIRLPGEQTTELC